MSDLPQISPLMDGLTVEERIAAKDDSRVYRLQHTASGVSCVVKHISVPASSIDTNALILTGAVQNEEEAHAYFESIVNTFRDELSVYRQLTASPYLCSYARFQVVPKDGKPGFDIYLLAPLRTSLKAYLEENAITAKMALQLATDLCRALTVLRRNGYIHQNLKPENIFLNNDVFSIGDFGLTSVEDLQHAAIPAKYVGSFTAPEACQSGGSLNLTSDLYSIGMLLYYIYNGNHAPFEEANSTKKYAENRRISGEELPAPIYADYEMDALIRKACALDPADRYQTPEELLAALEGYMERNTVDDRSVVPPLVVDEAPVESAAAEDEDEEDDLFAPLNRQPISDDFRESFKPASEEEEKPRKKHIWLPILLSVLVLLGAAFCYYYFELSAVTVDSITVVDKGTDYLTLAVEASDLEALMITCASEGEEGVTYYCEDEVTFSQLKPGTMYTITVDTIDFRYMHGTQGGTAVTASITEVLAFEVKDNGDGTYSADFRVSGPEPEAWKLTVSAEGHEPMVFSAENHTCELTGLLPNISYMLTLDTGSGYHLTGLTATTFSYAKSVTGSDLKVEEVTADSITVVWSTDDEEDETVWTAVCSGDNGYASTLEVTECRAVFENTSVSAEYTIAVSNDYMAMPLLLTVDCPAAEVTEITAEVEGTSATVSWEAEGLAVPETWILTYGVESMGQTEEIDVSGNSVTVEGLLPDAEYIFTLTDPAGGRINGTMETVATTEPAAEYEGNLPALFPGLFAEPKAENWDPSMISDGRNSFAPGEPIVFALEPIPKPAAQEEPVDVEVMLIIRNADGAPVTYSVETMSWNDMWKYKLFAACIDDVPEEPGTYSIELYFDSMLLKVREFLIAE
ncbi:MAG: protein kinase [Oscillospiraceae bacterium]|nr:protein kinase [Oscillospiraceae bacterium]